MQRVMADNKIVVLYVDDEENNLISFKATFRIKYKVLTAISGDEAMDILSKNKVEILPKTMFLFVNLKKNNIYVPMPCL